MSPVATTHPVRSRKEDRRQALVLAAFNQIAERGFEGLRTREVAAGVGLNIATLHYYCPTKETDPDGSAERKTVFELRPALTADSRAELVIAA